MLLKLARFERRKTLATKSTSKKKLYSQEKYEQLDLFYNISFLKDNSDKADTTPISKNSRQILYYYLRARFTWRLCPYTYQWSAEYRFRTNQARISRR